MADIKNGIVETKNLHICAACCKLAAAGRFTWPMAGGTLFLCCCAGDQRSVYNGSCGANPPPANVGGRVLFGV